MEPKLSNGGMHQDDRGSLRFFNNLDVSLAKRFYIIQHQETDTVRAWQGHQKEQKWFVILEGSFRISLVKPDHWENPSADLPVEHFLLNSDSCDILHVPGGYATGLQANVPNAKLMVFSEFTLEDSLKDDFRFDKALWFNWSEKK